MGVSQRSKYRRLYIKKAPLDVFAFTEEQAKKFEPHSIFTMDIGKSDNNLHVIEVGCFNNSGFYECELETIFKAV